MTRTLVTSLILAILASASVASDPDSDHDGLSDFQEIHKYRTNPQKSDSDGDGRPDGDWHERREYAYSVRSVVKVIRPCDLESIQRRLSGCEGAVGGEGLRRVGGNLLPL